MFKFLWPALLTGLSFSAVAQPSSRWELGVGAAVSSELYAGEGNRVQPIPLITYQGERFSVRGLTAGWKVIGNDAFELSAVAKLRLNGFKVDDLGKSELARNGVDYRLLEDRDAGLDLGLQAKWSGAWGEFEAEALANVSGASKGQEVSLQYGYPLHVGGGRLTPGVGVTWQSKKMANYYFGTLREEVARGVVDYKPGAVSTPHLSLSYFRPLGDKWSLMTMFKYSRLPSKIKNSPLVEADTDGTSSVFLGVSRQF